MRRSARHRMGRGGRLLEIINTDQEAGAVMLVARWVQTLRAFGFDRGVDHFGLVRQARVFDTTWEGRNLRHERSHRSVIDVGGSA